MTILEKKPAAPPAKSHSSRMTWILTAALAVALTAVAILTVALVNENNQPSASTPEQANYAEAAPGITAMLRARMAGMNTGDLAKAASFFAPNATLDEMNTGVVSTGRARVEARLTELYKMGMRLKAVGAPIQVGPYVAEPTRLWGAGHPKQTAPFMLVYEINQNGKIAYEWVIPG